MDIGKDNVWNAFQQNDKEGIDYPNVDFLFDISDFGEHAEEIRSMVRDACNQYHIPKIELEPDGACDIESGGHLYTNLVLLNDGKSEFCDGGFSSVEGSGDLYLFRGNDMINIGYSFSEKEKEAIIKTACETLDLSEKDYMKEGLKMELTKLYVDCAEGFTGYVEGHGSFDVFANAIDINGNIYQVYWFYADPEESPDAYEGYSEDYPVYDDYHPDLILDKNGNDVTSQCKIEYSGDDYIRYMKSEPEFKALFKDLKSGKANLEYNGNDYECVGEQPPLGFIKPESLDKQKSDREER